MNKEMNICLLVLSIFSFSAEAQEFDFDEADVIEDNKPIEIPLDLKFSLFEARQLDPDRSVKTGMSVYEVFDYNRDGLRLRIEGTGTYNRAYHIEDDPQEVVDKHELEWVTREFYGSKSWDKFTFLAGRHIKVLGKTDFLSPLDIVSPKDSTQLLFAKPEESRIGQGLVALDYFHRGLNIWLGAAPDPVFDRMAEPGHPYGLPMTLANVREIKDKSTEVYGKVEVITDDLEWAVVAAKSHIRSPLLGIDSTGTPNFYFPDYHILGFGMTYVLSPILLKLEVAHSNDYPDWQRDQVVTEVERNEAYFLSFGIDWNSDHWGSIAGEVSRNQAANRWGMSGQLLNQSQLAVSWSHDFLRETISTALTMLAFDSVENRIFRGDIGYRFIDDFELKLSATAVAVEGGTDTMDNSFDQLDRVELSFNWDYSLGG